MVVTRTTTFQEKDSSVTTSRYEPGQVAYIEELGVVRKEGSQDRALGLLAADHDPIDLDSAEAKRVLAKIDHRILPMIFVVFLMQVMDKNSLSFAAIMGIRRDTNLSLSEFSWLGSIVYFGYLAGEIPATYLMQRLPLAKYFSVMVMTWGVVLALHAVCHSFAGLMVVRFLLGFLEVCTAPSLIILTATWYRKEEQVTRTAIWFSSIGWSNIFGGFFAWVMYHVKSFEWQALFIFYGAFTFVLGLVLFFFLAASPTEARWLTQEEKIIALERVRDNKTGTEVWRFSRPQLKETFCDIRFYMVFVLMFCAGLPNGGITTFGPSLIEGFGFSTSRATLLNMGVGAATVAGFVIALTMAKYTTRIIAAMWVLILGCTGVIIMVTVPVDHTATLFGGYLLLLQFPVSAVFIISFITAGVAGSTKKFAFTAAYQIGLAVGSIIGPQTFRASEAPTYHTAKYIILACLGITALLLGTMALLHKLWNMGRDKDDHNNARDRAIRPYVKDEEFSDYTDFQLKSFRYPV